MVRRTPPLASFAHHFLVTNHPEQANGSERVEGYFSNEKNIINRHRCYCYPRDKICGGKYERN